MKVLLNSDEPFVHTNQVNEKDNKNLMDVDVIGDVPKMVAYDQESTIQVLHGFYVAE